MGSLKTFIKSVRNSKTIAAERAVIRKESAKIRTSFRDVHLDNEKRKKNIQKLLYLYILGEPTYFGQVECLKLLASPHFSDKRVAYMATMLILDENQEIITLLVNSLDIDMKSSNEFIVGLALCTLGNIASPELAKDLYSDVDNLLISSNSSYIKKKATLVASKLIEKEPDLSEVFLPRLPNLLNEKSHGVLLGTLKLIRSIFFNDETSHQELRKLIPKILTHLRLLTTTGYSPEYDIKGIPDPFLYVSILTTLKYLLKNDPENENLESLNDLLTQICAKLDNLKGCAYSILYETIETIFLINSDSSLKVLGINILSKFLLQKDNNIRYVALNTLLNVIDFEPLAVQRHRSTIVGCLQDGDISIRRRALELTFGIINNQNIRILIKELLNFLKNHDDELKNYITSQISISCNKYSPNLKWTLETLISMLKISGNFVSDEILSNILAIIMQNNDLNLTKYILVEMLRAAENNENNECNQYGFVLVTIWCLGEYGDLVINSKDASGKSIVDLLNYFLKISVFKNDYQNSQVKIYLLTACLKLSTRIKDSKLIEDLRQILNHFKNDINLEIQTKAIEYLDIFSQPLSIKRGLLERMPPPPFKKHEGFSLIDRSIHTNASSFSSSNAAKDFKNNNSQPSKTGDLLLDLLGDDENSKVSHNNNYNNNNNATSNKPESTMDLLSDIFGSSSITNNNNNNLGSNSKNEILNLFDSKTQAQLPSQSLAQTETIKEPVDSIEGFNDTNIRVGFVLKQIGNGTAELEAVVKNLNNNNKITNISVLCAVTKHQKLQLSSMNKNILDIGDFTILNIKIAGKEGSKIKIRVKLSYKLNNEIVNQQFDFSGISKLL